jgi:transposase
MRAKRSRYSEEFKSEALALMDGDDRSFRRLSEDLGVNAETLRYWYKQREMTKKRKGADRAQMPLVPKHETDEQRLARLERENKRLLRENETLRMDREILKKAAAFFAKESE